MALKARSEELPYAFQICNTLYLVKGWERKDGEIIKTLIRAKRLGYWKDGKLCNPSTENILFNWPLGDEYRFSHKVIFQTKEEL